jgi:heterodisulfide reductase subunit B
MGRHHILHDEKKRARVNELLQPIGRTVEGKSKVRHITDVLYNDVGVDKISKSIDKSLEGLHAVV